MVKRGNKLTDKTLTTNERILIHLKESSPLRDVMDAPYALTQHGISESVGIRVNHVSRAVKALAREKYVEETTGRVKGEIRKRKVYKLTNRGMAKAQEIAGELVNKTVALKDDEKSDEFTVEIAKKKLGGVSLATLLKSVDSNGAINLSARKKDREFVNLSRGLPRMNHFYGREGEMSVLDEWLTSRRERILSLSGARGIGKTTLALKAYEEWSSRRNTFWFSFQEWDTTESFLDALSDFLKDMGRRELRDYLKSARTIDMWEVSGWIERGLGDEKNILFLDEVPATGKSMESLLLSIIETVERTENTKMLITQDKREIPNRRSFMAREVLVEVDLLGLDKKSSKMLMSKEMTDSEFDRIYRLTEGNPLHVKLIESGKLEDLIDTKDYSPEELALLKYMKVIKETK